MAVLWGALGQVNPAIATLTTAYAVPAARHAAIYIIATNIGAGAATIRVAVSPAGAAINAKHYVLYDFPVAIGASQSTAKLIVAATDVVRVYASTADVAFNVNGIEDDN